MEKVTVSADALRKLLEALNGPAHYIRERQATRGPLVGDDNPINLLIAEYNQQTGTRDATEEPDITINGHHLNKAQAMAVRVAVCSFDSELRTNQASLGDDEHGRTLTTLYRARTQEAINYMLNHRCSNRKPIE